MANVREEEREAIREARLAGVVNNFLAKRQLDESKPVVLKASDDSTIHLHLKLALTLSLIALQKSIDHHTGRRNPPEEDRAFAAEILTAFSARYCRRSW